ncbi:MAG: hypothetical protein ACKOSQ_04255 [Planctomycetaceae bacterium]
MQTGEILLVATVALVLLGGLVSLGMGHRRWSIGTVVAGFLVLLSAATFLYLAARLAQRERLWAQKIADYQLRLATAVDDQVLDTATGRFVPQGGGAAGDGPQSLPRLRTERDRWRRGLDRVETWHGRTWRDASFQPPRDDATPGRIELAAEANAEDTPPIGVGSHVFLFDSIPIEEGGAYVGEFLVQGTSYDQATKRHTLAVVQTNPRDAYDDKVLARPHDSVTVFENLPVDRWLAFYRSRRAGADAALPEPTKEDAGKVQEQLGALIKDFVDLFKQHEEDVPKDEWPEAEARAAEQPGELWAEVEFAKPYSFPPVGEAPPAEGPAAEEGPKRDFEAGDRIEFDLQTAVGLRDADGTVTIERVFRRRPLTDALTLLHGSLAPVGDEAIPVEGTPSLVRRLRDEIAALERSNERLQAAQQAAAANTKDDLEVVRQLELDLTSWRRDSDAAAALVAGFERERDRTARALAAAEAAIVANGRDLAAAMDRLAREIDRAAPPPDRRAAQP